MSIAIGVYVFMAASTMIAVLRGYSLAEVVACFLIGLSWPLFWMVKIMQKFLGDI